VKSLSGISEIRKLSQNPKFVMVDDPEVVRQLIAE
jgi:hypothetical protein